MLIHCPRCGFEQPQDKFCAQCGVDMENYKPARPPLSQRILKSSLLQLSLLLIVASLVGTFLFKKGHYSFKGRSGPPSSSLQLSAADTSSLSDPQTQNLADSPPPPSSPPEAPSEQPLRAFKVSDPNEAPGVTTAPIAKIDKPEVVIYFAEVSKDTLGNLINASRNAGQFQDFNFYTAGLFPNLGKTLTATGVKILRQEKRFLEGEKNFRWQYTIKDPNEPQIELGLSIALSAHTTESESLSGHIDIQRSWREPTPTGELTHSRRSFPAEFEIDSEAGFFISGVLPRRSYLDNDQDLTNIDIYKILSSPQFRAGESSFVIFIDFVNNK